jgi:hypothetical protein
MHLMINKARRIDQPSGLVSATLLTAWMVWKWRNACVFDKDQPSVPLLVERIRAEVALWAKAGAASLRVMIPKTWDVH